MVNDTLADHTVLTHGVSQGTLMGPLSFVIFINEFFVLVMCIYCIYADDNVIYCSNKKCHC